MSIDHQKKAAQDEHDHGDGDESYFRSYDVLPIHREMVANEIRTNAYRRSIHESDSLNKKTVLDLGCGTGILSIFACQAGASKVYAIDASDIIRLAQKVVEKNGYADKIKLVHSKIEDFQLPPNEKVDVIISEWMGYALFDEWMLPDVISARDRLLKKGGLIFPQKAVMHIALATETNYIKNRKYWQDGPKNSYDVDMSILADEEYKSIVGKRVVHQVEPTEIVSEPQEILSIDIQTLKFEDSKAFFADFRLKATRSCDIYGFCLWFKVLLPGDITLCTSPFKAPTHWQQTILYVPTFAIKQGAEIFGNIRFCSHPKWKRLLAVDLKFTLDDGNRISKEMHFLETLEAYNCVPK